jgi:hypothetical protein
LRERRHVEQQERSEQRTHDGSHWSPPRSPLDRGRVGPPADRALRDHRMKLNDISDVGKGADAGAAATKNPSR